MFVNVIFLCFSCSTAELPRAPLLPPGISLVRAVVIDEEELQFDVRNTLRIEHVYLGAAGLRGASFAAFSANRLPQGNKYVVVPRLGLKESGIWLINDGNQNLRTENWYNYMRWPARPVRAWPQAPRYETISEFAEHLEAVSRLGESRDVTAAIEGLATHRNPYLSSWAISRLAVPATQDEEVAGFLDQLVGSADVPVQGQVELDKALIEVRGAPWRGSEMRLDLFRNWLKARRDARDANLIVTRLDETSQHPATNGFPQVELLRLTRMLVENEHFPIAERENARTVLMWAARRYDTDQKVFEMAADLVGSDLPEEIRRSVASLFIYNFDLDAARREVLNDLRRNANGQSVMKALDVALARPDKIKKP